MTNESVEEWRKNKGIIYSNKHRTKVEKGNVTLSREYERRFTPYKRSYQQFRKEKCPALQPGI